MKQKSIYVGSVSINISKVDIFLDSENVGTDFSAEGSTTLHLNINEKDWNIMVSDLLHELTETYLFKTGCRYVDTSLPETYEAISCKFIISHDELQLCCHEVGHAVGKILPALYKAFNRKK